MPSVNYTSVSVTGSSIRVSGNINVSLYSWGSISYTVPAGCYAVIQAGSTVTGSTFMINSNNVTESIGANTYSKTIYLGPGGTIVVNANNYYGNIAIAGTLFTNS